MNEIVKAGCENCRFYSNTSRCINAGKCVSSIDSYGNTSIPSKWMPIPSSAYTHYNKLFKPKSPRQKALERIKNVIFNDPCTIVLWADGTKTVVKCGEGEVFDPEKGLAMAISKYFFDNKGYYNDVFKKWLPEEESEEKISFAEGINQKHKEFAGEVITLKEYCTRYNVTKNVAYDMIKRGRLLAEKNEKGHWMIKVYHSARL